MCISTLFELIIFQKKCCISRNKKKNDDINSKRFSSKIRMAIQKLLGLSIQHYQTYQLPQTNSNSLIALCSFSSNFCLIVVGKKKRSLKEIPQHLLFDACFSSCRRDSTTLAFCGDDLWRFFWHPIVGITLHQPLDFMFKTHWWHSGGKSWGRWGIPKLADLKNPCISREVPFHLYNIRSIPTCCDTPKLPYKVSNRACVAEEFVIQRHATGTCRHHTTAIWTMTRKTPSGTLMTGNPPAFFYRKCWHLQSWSVFQKINLELMNKLNKSQPKAPYSKKSLVLIPHSSIPWSHGEKLPEVLFLEIEVTPTYPPEV